MDRTPPRPAQGDQAATLRRTTEIHPDDVRSFDALWSEDHWERRADTESLRAWLGLSPTATLTDLPPIREEFAPPQQRPAGTRDRRTDPRDRQEDRLDYAGPVTAGPPAWMPAA